jgi:hypothetical protein
MNDKREPVVEAVANLADGAEIGDKYCSGVLKRPDLGTLAVGKTADIIAMPGDPLLDITITGKVDFVMKDGLIYKRPEHRCDNKE